MGTLEKEASRLQELRFLRANCLASPILSDFRAIEDLDAVITDAPTSARAHLEKAKILRRSRKPSEALESLQRVLEHASGRELSAQESTWIRTSMQSLRDIVALGDTDG